jgi:hypothetical protein
MPDFLWLEARAVEITRYISISTRLDYFYTGVTSGSPSHLSAWPFSSATAHPHSTSLVVRKHDVHPLINPLIIFPGSERGLCIRYMNYTFLNSGTAAPPQQKADFEVLYIVF